jgi:hypothetical protein
MKVFLCFGNFAPTYSQAARKVNRDCIRNDRGASLTLTIVYVYKKRYKFARLSWAKRIRGMTDPQVCAPDALDAR